MISANDAKYIHLLSIFRTFQSFSYCSGKYERWKEGEYILHRWPKSWEICGFTRPFINSVQSYLFCYKYWLFFDNRIIDILYILNKSICSVKYVLKWFVFIPSSHCNRLPLDGNARNFCVSVVHFTGHNWIPKTVYCIKHVTICRIRKIALLRGSMVVTYYINLFWTGTDRYNGILMSLLRLVAETIICRH